jgi:hypothetical protein
MSAPTASDTARNATLADLATLLQDQQTRKHDIVVPASKVRAEHGDLIVEGAEPEVEITEEGVTVISVDGRYTPTAICDEGIAAKLGVPTGYLRRTRNEFASLYDANVNGWLHGYGDPDHDEDYRDGDDRSFLLRTFRGRDGEQGVARAFLSDSFKAIDNLDVLVAGLEGIRRSGTEIEIRGCDLTDRRMYIDVYAPAVAAMAPVLLGGYRNPFEDPEVEAARRGGGSDLEYWRGVAAREGMGYEPGTEPVVFAGFRISNSEVGGGAFSIVPKLMVKVCRNGLVLNQDAIKNVHLGAKLEEGLVQWSAETQRKALDLITSKAADAVATFLDAEYLQKALARIEERAGKPVTEPEKQVKAVTKVLGFSEVEAAGVLGHFIRGGQMTAGGVVNAITSYSQTIADADRADTLDGQALRALTLV